MMFGQKVVHFSDGSLYANDLININKRFTNFSMFCRLFYVTDKMTKF